MEISITWNICRVCLVEEEKTPQTADLVEPMRDIFNKDGTLAKQIFECSGITMKPNDNLPEKICKKCFTMVKCAVNFRNICRASDAYLQSILQRTQSASALLKPEQIILNHSQECNETIKVAQEDDASIVKAIEHEETKLDESGKLRSDIDSAETHSKKALIRSENSDNVSEHELNNISQEIALFDYSSCNEMMYSKPNNTKENEDCKLNENFESALIQDLQMNDTCSENDDFEEKPKQSLNSLKKNSDSDTDENTKNVCISTTESEQHIDGEYQIEGFEQDESSQLSHIEREGSQEILHQLESNVSSTVKTKEYDIEIDEEDCSLLSENNNGLETEYIVDEYFIDTSNNPVSMRKYATKHSITSSSSLKAVPENYVVWICDICGNHFLNRQLLHGHMKIHSQDKKHECEICAKRFITACNLQAHMRVHTGEKPFECPYCGRRFSDRSAHLRHQRTHTNEKPFQCKDCGKAFSLSTTLKTHLKVHTGERSYRCDICMKSFKLAHQLKAHQNSSVHKQ